jgi:hypothetical protein
MTERKVSGWSQARLVYYIGTALFGGAVLVSSLGYADFDTATGEIDFHPFNIYTLAAVVAGPLFGLSMAALAVLRGWGK